jgi:hypothetical protein
MKALRAKWCGYPQRLPQRHATMWLVRAKKKKGFKTSRSLLLFRLQMDDSWSLHSVKQVKTNFWQGTCGCEMWRRLSVSMACDTECYGLADVAAIRTLRALPQALTHLEKKTQPRIFEFLTYAQLTITSQSYYTFAGERKRVVRPN